MTDLVIIHNHPIHYQHLLFLELANQGLNFEVLFTAGSSIERLEQPLPQRGEYRYRIGYPGPYEQASAIGTARFVWRALRALSPRVVIISGYSGVAAWTAWLWVRYAKARCILWAESNEFDQPRSAWKEFPKRIFVARCDRAHVYGSASKAYIEKLGMPAAKIFTGRAVVDADRFLAIRDPIERPEKKLLLYVGRFSPEKNLPFLLRAFRGVDQDHKNPELILMLVGYGPLDAELRKLAADLGIAGSVRFPGKALQAELPSIYQAADAFVLPSTREPWGLVANEAMLCGLPVLISSQCGCAADLAQPESGWTFSPWDETGLTGILNEIVRTPRDSLQAKGRAAKRVAMQYSPANCARIVAASVNECAG
ncbi:MAG: glycosyltransferase [Acidobacteria bacterium]|nr:glycosyltransferase [Acidobacteriota bacterium]